MFLAGQLVRWIINFDLLVWLERNCPGLPEDEYEQRGCFPNVLLSVYLPSFLSLGIFLAGLVGCVLVFQMKRFKIKRNFILFGTGAVYLAFMVPLAYLFARGSQSFNSVFRTEASWVLVLEFQTSPFISILVRLTHSLSLSFSLSLSLTNTNISLPHFG